MATIGEENKTRFKQESHRRDWPKTISDRILAQTRHMSQGLNEKKVPKWIEEFRNRLPVVEDDEEQYYVGWDTELRQAWRSSTSDANRKEFADDECIMGDTDGDPITAKWSDGFEHIITDITIGQFKEVGIQQPAGVKYRSEGPHRPRIISIYVDGDQKCQARPDLFKNPTAAEKFMKDLATSYCDGAVELEQLHSARDDKLQDTRS
ncbi:unnamed protein product, partial [Prorocentrum cordatum]